jgi:HK97 family phage prohead protease
MSSILARSNGSGSSMQIGTDNQGLWFRFDLPETTLGNDTLELMKRGDIEKCSFSFIPGTYEMSYDSESGQDIVRHTQVDRLIDVSLVTFPAYEGTSASLRSDNPLVEKVQEIQLSRNKSNARCLAERQIQINQNTQS